MPPNTTYSRPVVFTFCIGVYRWGPSSWFSSAHRYGKQLVAALTLSQFLTAPEEDVLASYSRVLLKLFLAEGVMCGHSLFLASASEDPNELLRVKIHMHLLGNLFIT